MLKGFDSGRVELESQVRTCEETIKIIIKGEVGNPKDEIEKFCMYAGISVEIIYII